MEQPTDTVHRFNRCWCFKTNKKNNPNKAKPKKESIERIKAKEDALNKEEKS